MRFKNNNVIITGGTRGIGKGIAQAFLAEGANVTVTYAGNDQAANEFASANADAEGTITLAKFDVSNPTEVENFVNSIPEEQSIDILINNAGIRKDNVVALMPVEDWQRVMNVNLDSAFYMSRLIVKKMLSNRYGRIINITSPCSYFGFAGQANYAASKAGMIGLTRSLSKEVAKKKITVNCISPGFTNTELLDDLDPELAAGYKKQVPMKRFGSVEEISAPVLFFASKEASYITGATLEVTGGL